MGARQSHEAHQASGTAAAADSSKSDAATATSAEAASEAINGRLIHDSIAEEHQQYAPPTSPVKPMVHYIFLVHGIFGNDQEMGYLAKAFQKIAPPSNGDETSDLQHTKRVKRSSSELTQQMLADHRRELGELVANAPPIVVHSVKCNVGKTHDGIRNGGARMANEVTNFIRSDVQQRIGDKTIASQNVTYSIVGNSLGGLYARYAVSLLPYQLQLHQHNPASTATIHLHPNVFCTTATPHLGVSRHTYLPLPRFAEAAIGAGMGTTGRDLFRLNSQKDLASAAAENVVGVAERGVRRLSALRPKGKGEEDSSRDPGEEDFAGDSEDAVMTNADDDLEMECIIRNMCLQDKYLAPLRHFRRRIAYANAYGTDFQVPCLTAAFLHERSGVGHFVETSRDLPPPPVGAPQGSEEGNPESSTEMGDSEEQSGVPSFIVATVRTETTTQPQSPTKARSDASPSDDLLRMSQSLDALGWTKVFIDVRDRIPVPRLAKPMWLRPPCGSLDELIRERGGLTFASLSSSGLSAANDASESRLKVDANELILTSQELAQSTNAGDSIDFPLGHTVMVANSKNEKYSELNSQGRPVMDKLARDMVQEILGFV